jgi:hypothetical protein
MSQKIKKNMLMFIKIKGKSIPVAGHGGPYSHETSRLPHFLDNRLTVGGVFVSLKCQPSFTPQENSLYSFLLEYELPPGPQCDWKDFVN